MNILGVSCYFHDASAALLRDGHLVAAAEEERFTRIKHDFGFPRQAIAFCLRQARISGTDLDYVAFFEKPLVKFERILQTALSTAPRSATVFRKALTTWMLDKLWIKGLLRHEVGVPPERILFCDHHESHAASAFFASPFDEAAVLTIDGVGEWTTTALGSGRGTSLRLTHEIRFPHSLGLLYSAFTAFLGFEVNEGEYKVMGMAPYGRPRYVDKVWKTVRLEKDGSFILDLSYFSFHYSADRTYSQKFIDLFGPPRKPGVPFFTQDTEFPSYYGEKPPDFDRLAAENQHYADVAASVQAVTEDIILAMVREAHGRTGHTKLCMAGGVALNSVANGRILRETPITDLFIQPAAGDGGGALGAALYAYHTVLGHPRAWRMEHAYWGATASHDEIRAAVAANGLRAEEFGEDDRLLDRTVDLLTRGKVIGWAQGAFEFGPRALGNRSILADPRSQAMKDIVNTKIKFREPYRPFAPAVLVERAGEFFALAEPERHYPARFMLLVTPVKNPELGRVQAVTHADNSARLQTVRRDLNPRYYDLIARFGQATGVPVVLNTSFNLRGEPIVNTPAEAISTFQRSGMDALVLEHTLVLKDGDPV